MLKQREDLLGTTSSPSLVYATLDGWRRQMAERGHDLLDAALHRAARIRQAVADMPGLRLMGPEVVEAGPTAELDLLRITIDVRGLGISGMQAAEWLRTHCHVDFGSSDTCRIEAARLRKGSRGGRPPGFGEHRCEERNTVERTINRLRRSRAVATRSGRRGYVFLATATALTIWLRT